MRRAFDPLADVLRDSGVAPFMTAVNSRPLAASEVNELLLYLIGWSSAPWVTALVNAGADVNHRNDEGETPLSVCVHLWADTTADRLADIRENVFCNALELLSLGADPNGAYMGARSVTALAVDCNSPELAALFLLAGAELDRREPDSGQTETLREVMLKSSLLWPRQLARVAENEIGE